MDSDNNLAYTEVDAASQGLVDNIRQLKDLISYKAVGSNTKILCLDESHMLSAAAQNALLQTIEEGQKGVIFFFCTTEVHKMLPTIRSRCVELKLGTLTATQIAERLRVVCDQEKLTYEDKALRIIGTYVRGHMRDALVLLEQLARLSGEIKEENARTYLKLDRKNGVYELLTITERKPAMEKLEGLLCEFAMGELINLIGEVLIDAYKVDLGMDIYSQMDTGWLKKIKQVQGDQLLSKAERVLLADTNVSSLAYGVAVIMGTLFSEGSKSVQEPAEVNDVHLRPTMMRKPGK